MADFDREVQLPETVSLTQDDLDEHWELWLRWRATEKRFLPSQLLRENDRHMHVILELDSLYSIIEKQVLDKKRNAPQDPLDELMKNG